MHSLRNYTCILTLGGVAVALIANGCGGGGSAIIGDAGSDSSTEASSGSDSGHGDTGARDGNSGTEAGGDGSVSEGGMGEGGLTEGGDASEGGSPTDGATDGSMEAGATCTTVGTACSTAGEICCAASASSNACVTGNCCTNTQCSGVTPACNPANHTCAACDAPSGATVVVDPVNGSDATGQGSGTVGGQADGICAFKTISYALAHLGTATTISVLPTGTVGTASGETFPLTLPASVDVVGATSGTPTVMTVPAAGAATNSGVGFVLASDGSSVRNFTIGGGSAATHGILVTTGATLSTNIGSVEVSGFVQAGVRVEVSAQLTINAGTNLHTNGTAGSAELSGLHVTGAAHVAIVGAASAPIQFNTNGQSGILVDGLSWVTLTGTPGSSSAGSVVANNNTVDGIEIHQEGNGIPTNTITGLVAASNTQDGARIYANSVATVRGSVFMGNGADGVDIQSTGVGATQTFDVTGIDLGTDLTTNAGGNVLQSTSSPNNGAGLCLDIPASKGMTLMAQGNKWVTASGPIDCATTIGTLTESASVAILGRACLGAVDIGGSGLSGTVTPNGVNVNECTCGGTGTICN
jgi:hypothetical protein